jgi:hypothetical protein
VAYTPPQFNNQRCLQALPEVPWGSKITVAKNHQYKRYCKNKTNVVLDKNKKK